MEVSHRSRGLERTLHLDTKDPVRSHTPNSDFYEFKASHLRNPLRPQFPPSPPSDMSNRYSLPPISDLLNLPNARRSPNYVAHERARNPYEASFASYRGLNGKKSPPPRLPPTPPPGPFSAGVVEERPNQQFERPRFGRTNSYQYERHQPIQEPSPCSSQRPSIDTSTPSLTSSLASPYPSTTSSQLLPSPDIRRRSEPQKSCSNYTSPVYAHSYTYSDGQIHDIHLVEASRRSLPENVLHPKEPYSPVRQVPATLQNQRALPTDFPPRLQVPPPQSPSSQPPSATRSAFPSTEAPRPWHHNQHRSSQSSTHSQPPHSATFASHNPSQNLPERYACPTCGKSFSRPSSLRIHSYSHTGEKPFQCPKEGCGKAFSVRSNMKRHERGCHVGGSGASSALQPNLPGGPGSQQGPALGPTPTSESNHHRVHLQRPRPTTGSYQPAGLGGLMGLQNVTGASGRELAPAVGSI